MKRDRGKNVLNPSFNLRNEKSGTLKKVDTLTPSAVSALNAAGLITLNSSHPVALPINVKITHVAYPARIPKINGISLAVFLP